MFFVINLVIFSFSYALGFSRGRVRKLERIRNKGLTIFLFIWQFFF